MTVNCYGIKRLWRTDSWPAAELQTNTKLPLNADEQALFEESGEVSCVNVLIQEEFIFEKLSLSHSVSKWGNFANRHIVFHLEQRRVTQFLGKVKTQVDIT